LIRYITLAGTACFVGAIVATSLNHDLLGIALGLVSLLIAVGLLFRRLFHAAKDAVNDARAFVSGDVQQARIIEVGDPKGWSNTRSNVVLELEAEDGTRRSFDHDIPVPFFVAWGYRLSKRFKVPLISQANLTELMGIELRREGLDVSLSREAAG
jgi:hypothetical protein